MSFLTRQQLFALGEIVFNSGRDLLLCPPERIVSVPEGNSQNELFSSQKEFGSPKAINCSAKRLLHLFHKDGEQSVCVRVCVCGEGGGGRDKNC